MSNVAIQVPLLELLKDVPADGRDCYEVHATHHRFIPYGRMCHEAADEIIRLQGREWKITKERDWLRRVIANSRPYECGGDGCGGCAGCAWLGEDTPAEATHGQDDSEGEPQ